MKILKPFAMKTIIHIENYFYFLVFFSFQFLISIVFYFKKIKHNLLYYKKKKSSLSIKLSILYILFYLQAFSQGTKTISSGSGNWIVPYGVTSITVKCWGGGGGGGGSTSNNYGGGGGGSGGYCTRSINVSAGDVFTYSVGTGGTVSTGNGNQGGNTTFSGNSQSLTANGGTGGKGGVSGTSGSRGIGGSASGGTTNTTGNDGSNGTTYGAAGGSAPGSGGSGGSGSLTNANGNSGSAPGGGGGGGEYGGGSSKDGGEGGAGRITIEITYTQNTFTMGTSGSQSAIILNNSENTPDKFYDNGGSGSNYSNNVNATYTFNCASGKYVRMKVTYSGSTGETFKVYDGSSTSTHLCGEGWYTTGGSTYFYCSTTGSLTVAFTSDASTVNSGWSADVWIDDEPGQVWNGASSVYTLASNWEGNVNPTQGTSVYIPSSSAVMPTVSTVINVDGIFIENGATLNVTSSFDLYGNLKVEGILNQSSGTYLFCKGGTSSIYTTISGNGDMSNNNIAVGYGANSFVKLVGNISIRYFDLYNSGISYFDMNDYNLTVSTVFNTEASQFFYQGSGQLSLGMQTPTILDGSFYEETGTTIFNRAGLQTIPAITYYNLSTTGADTKTFAASTVDINGTVNIGSTSTLATGNFNCTVAGNWTNNGTFTCGTGTVTFDGSAAQTINGSNSTTFYKLTLNNTSATGLTLAINTTIENQITLTDGLLYTDAYILSLGKSSSNATVTGGSSVSYIVAYDNSGTIGYVKSFVNSNTSYSFPIGDLTRYTPLTYTQSSATLSSAFLTVYTNAVKVPGMNSSIANYVNRFWEVTPSGITSPTYSISYVYADGDIVGSETNFKPVKKSSSTWYKPTGCSFLSGTEQGSSSLNAGTNTLTWSSLTSFSSFGGAGDQAIALPIELLTFEAKKYQKNVKVNWKTASEINNDYFTVERSLDGESFSKVSEVDGAGNSTQTISYFFIDTEFSNGINYYRLIQTDYNGTETSSEIVAVDMTKIQGEKVMTVNTAGQEVNESYSGVVFDMYSDGSLVKRMQ